jgi:hypothetical protein
MAKAKTAFQDIWSVITSISDYYEFEPVLDEKDFLSVYKPFEIGSVAEIVRREDILEIKTARRVRGFGNGQTLASVDSETVYYVYPFIWEMHPLSRTLKAMLFQEGSTMITVSLKPVIFTKQLESLLSKQIELIERSTFLHKTDIHMRLISRNLHNQLHRLEDSSFYFKIYIASERRISKGLIDAFGVDITGRAGSPDILRDVNEDYVFSGGYKAHLYNTAPEKERVIEDLIGLELSFTAPTIAPQDYKEIRYLVDSTQANCTFRFPVPQVEEIPGVQTKSFKSVPPPIDIPTEGILLGFNKKEGFIQNVGLLQEDRRRSLYVVGQTGTGKSTLLTNLILQDLEKGEGVIVFDLHSELIDDVLRRLPKNRWDDVIYINFEDTERPVALNMLECETDSEKDLSVRYLLEIFDRLYDTRQVGDLQFEMYLKNALYLIMEDPDSGSTLLEVQKIFTDPDFRNHKLSKTENRYVKEFWEAVTSPTSVDPHLVNITPYITSRFSSFLYNNILRKIITSQRSSIPFRALIEEGKILLVDLCKGKAGVMTSYFLGMLLLHKILATVLSRSTAGRDLYLYIDEFQNLATESFISLLSETRKYRLNLTLANQYLTQIPPEARSALSGNVGTLITFRPGLTDAEILEEFFLPTFTKNDLLNLPDRRICINMLAHDQKVRSFEIGTFPLPEEKNDRDRVREIKERGKERKENR